MSIYGYIERLKNQRCDICAWLSWSWLYVDD